MNMPTPLTDEQKREIVRLRRARTQYKVIARSVGCTPAQVIHAWKSASNHNYSKNRRQKTLQNQRTRRAANKLRRTVLMVAFPGVTIETMGGRIRRLRGSMGWSGATVAEKLGCSEPAISYWENDLRTPSPHHLASLANALGVTASYLMRGGVP